MKAGELKKLSDYRLSTRLFNTGFAKKTTGCPSLEAVWALSKLFKQKEEN
jgi:hypothetical protein